MMPAMTERQGFGETPTACPFLAFEDDRDFRSDRPDHRHRCFAEARPAPRAISHQELFCLGGAFAECPTFVEWAAREAAAVKRSSVRRPAPPAPGSGASRPASGGGSSAATSSPPASRGRDWLAPPPWLAAEHATDAVPGEAGEAGVDRYDSGLFDDIEPPMPPTGSVALSGTAAAATVEGAAQALPVNEVAPPPFLAGRSRAVPSAPPSGGSTSSPSERRPTTPVAGSTRASSPPFTTSRDVASRIELDDDLDIYDGPVVYGAPGVDEEIAAAADARIARARAEADGATGGSSRFSAPGRKQQGGSGQARPLPPRAADPAAPSWERPRKLEAYPAIKSERRIPGIPKVAIWAGLLILAALALFLIPPLLLGGGGKESASPTPRESATASGEPSPSPTKAPAPTPSTYTVKSGDTLSAIAAKYKVTVDDLLAANPDLKDPNQLQIGDKIIIPLPPSQTIPDGGTVEDTSPSPSP